MAMLSQKIGVNKKGKTKMEFNIEIVREDMMFDFECEVESAVRNVEAGNIPEEVAKAKLKGWADCLSFYDICDASEHIDMKILIDNAFYEMNEEN